jgi:Ser/Thr protein kinase RdoA (MazF antagonist)
VHLSYFTFVCDCKLNLLYYIRLGDDLLLKKLILDNYSLEVSSLTLIDSHFGTEIFLLESDKGKYIVKTLPLYVEDVENEGYITEFLFNNDISVARLLKSNDGKYLVKTSDMQFHVQEFIEGETLKINTAPDWFLDKTADLLGKIHKVLQGYGELKINFGEDFFNASTIDGAIRYYSDKLDNALQQKDSSLIKALEERIRHLKRLSSFDIDVSKMTYTNSHGDFHLGQIITQNKNITVIDWTSACRVPVSLEIITSYVTSDPECKYGKIDCNRLKKYINEYSKHTALNEYDLLIMPYIYYFQQIICHYTPPYDVNVAESYKPICDLINRSTNWLYQNIETLSNELCAK